MIQQRQSTSGASYSSALVSAAWVKSLTNDRSLFLVFFAVAAGVGLVELPLYTKVVVAIVLAFGYGLYVR